jgi:uncharacterized membrane protein
MGEGGAQVVTEKVTKVSVSPHTNVNRLHDASLTFGERMSDGLAKRAGSWTFILSFLGFLAVWIGINAAAYAHHRDPYPFILLPLVLSCIAAFQAPVIMMSQNRQAAKDRIEAENDYVVNQKAFADIEGMMRHLDGQDHALLRLEKQNTALLEQNARLLAALETSAVGKNDMVEGV